MDGLHHHHFNEIPNWVCLNFMNPAVTLTKSHWNKSRVIPTKRILSPVQSSFKNFFTCEVKFRTKFLCSSLELYQISTSWTLRYRFKSWHVRIQCYVLSSHFNVIPFILSGLFWPETRLENNWNSFFFFWNSNWKISIWNSKYEI